MSGERKVVKAGYLVKSPPQEKLMAHWHRRYFILWSTKLMEYYTSHEHKPEEYLKTINLGKCEDMVAPLPITNRPNVIKLSVRISNKLRDYYLDCGTEEEMMVWIKCLARVCGFAPVDEEDEDSHYSIASEPGDGNYSIASEPGDGNYSIASEPGDGNYSIATEPDDQPLYDDIENNERFQEPSSKLKARPQLMPTHLKPSFSQDDITQMTYDEPLDHSNNYHVLEDNGSMEASLEKGEGVKDQWYDDMGIDDTVVYNMNKRPPPVWRPEAERLQAPPLPPNRRAVSSEPEERRKISLDVGSPLRKLDLSRGKDKPVPPPKPRASGEPAFSPRRESKDLFGIRDNPKFKLKLQEKRQELYGDTRMRSLSMGEGEDLAQECYESVLFTVDDTKDVVPRLPPKTETLRRECMLQLFSQKGSGGRPPDSKLSHSAQNSPRCIISSGPMQHRGGDSTPTSPPPLPSRELIDPTMPTYKPSSLQTTPQEELPPPVPLRDSSRQLDHVRENRRRNSLPTSPTAISTSRLDRSKPLPLPIETRSSELPARALANIISSSPNHIKGKARPAHIQEKALPPTPPGQMQERAFLPTPPEMHVEERAFLPTPPGRMQERALLPTPPEKMHVEERVFLPTPPGRMQLQERALPPTPPGQGHMQERALPPTPPGQGHIQERALPPTLEQASGEEYEDVESADYAEEILYDDIVPAKHLSHSLSEKSFSDPFVPVRTFTPPPPTSAQNRFSANPLPLPPNLKSNRLIAVPPKPASSIGQQRAVSPMRQLTNELSSQQRVTKGKQKDVSPMRQPSNELSSQQRVTKGQQKDVSPMRQHLSSQLTKGQQRDVSPMRQLTNELSSQQRVSKNPPLPPNKPGIARGQGSASGGGVAISRDQKPKPQVAKKPSLAKKPVITAEKPVPPPVSKKPPMQPKPARIVSNTVSSPTRQKPPPPVILRNTPPAKSLPPQTGGHKAKPPVPKKPITPLCS